MSDELTYPADAMRQANDQIRRLRGQLLDVELQWQATQKTRDDANAELAAARADAEQWRERAAQAGMAAEAARELLKLARLWVYNATFDVGDLESETVHVYYRNDVLPQIDALLAAPEPDGNGEKP